MLPCGFQVPDLFCERRVNGILVDSAAEKGSELNLGRKTEAIYITLLVQKSKVFQKTESSTLTDAGVENSYRSSLVYKMTRAH